MRERINRLARGIIDSSVPELVIKPERIEGILSPGESVRGEFSVQSGNDLYIKGLVYTGNERIKVENEAFGGPSLGFSTITFGSNKIPLLL